MHDNRLYIITIDAISAASKLLNQMDESSQNESLRENLADYITNAIIIEDISSNPYTTDRTTDRVYAYYKYLYDMALRDEDDKDI